MSVADALLTQQATIIAYANSYMLLMWLTLAALPLILMIGSSKVACAKAADTHVALD